MLQQTRVTTVIPYYERFLARFPTAEAMARAEESEVLALWAGLGYYSRARNLHRAAKLLKPFPSTYEEIRALPGVGDYTAAAVASIAFGLPHAVVDGNVLRVLSRVTVRTPTRELAQSLLSKCRPGDYNQALMELGATVCTPRQPKCSLCPWRDLCQAHALGKESEFPAKRKKRDSVRIKRHLLVIENKGRVVLRPGPGGFWELPEAGELAQAVLGEPLGSFRHSITHHIHEVQVSRAQLRRIRKPYLLVGDLSTRPVSTMTKKALRLAGLHP